MGDPISKYINENGKPGSPAIQFYMLVDAGGNPINPAAINGKTTSRPIYPTMAAFQADIPNQLTNTVELDGYYAPGDGKGGKLVRTTRPVGRPGTRKDFSGANWLLVNQASGNSAESLGRKADGIINTATWNITSGTINDDVAIQEDLDLQGYGSGTKAILGGGISILSRSIQIGYGDNQITATLEGQGATFAPSGGFPGATGLHYPFTRDAAINVQGGRGSGVSKLAITGNLTAYLIANSCGIAAGSLIDDTLRSNWAPSTDQGQDNQWAPWCALSVDGRIGTPNAGGSYPPYTYPNWTANQNYYQKLASTVSIFDKLRIQGFNTALVVGPNGVAANGDFTHFPDSAISYGMFGISVGETQSRQVVADNLSFTTYYCLVTTNTHGSQQGEWGGVNKNWSGGELIKIISLASLGITGPVKFDQLYCEGLYQFGDVGSGGQGNAQVTFDGCTLAFAGFQNMVRGIPAAVFQAPVALAGPGKITNAPLVLRGGTANFYWSVIPLLSNNLKIDDYTYLLSKRFQTNQGQDFQAYMALCHNATCDGLVVPVFNGTNFPIQLAFSAVDLDTLAINSVKTCDDYPFASRNFGAPLYIKTAKPATCDVTRSQKVPQLSRVYGMNLDATATFDQTTGAFTFKNAYGYTQDQIESFGGAPGDMILEGNTDTTVFIWSADYSGNVFTGTAQNNIQNAGRTCAEKATWPNPSTGSAVVVNNRLYLAAAPITGTATSGSPILTGVTGLTSGAANQKVAVGDRVFIDPNNNPLALTPSNNKITGIGSGTLTLANNMTLNGTVTLWWFVRAPPANASHA